MHPDISEPPVSKVKKLFTSLIYIYSYYVGLFVIGKHFQCCLTNLLAQYEYM